MSNKVSVTNADIWELFDIGNSFVVVPTNISVKANGNAVMGRGIAAQAARKYPQLPKLYGKAIANGKTIFCATVWNSMPNKGGIELSRADTIVNASNLLIPACPSEILDADMPESSYVAWIDEGTDMLEFKVKYSDGTVKSVSIGPLLV